MYNCDKLYYDFISNCKMKKPYLHLYAFEKLEFDDVYDTPKPKEKVKHETLDVSNVTEEQLNTEVANLKKEIEQLKRSRYYIETAEGREDINLKLKELEWELKNYTWVSDIANMVEDGKIRKKGFLWIWNEKKKIERRIKKINQFKSDMEVIKKQLGIDVSSTSKFTKWVLPKASFDINGHLIIEDKTNSLPKQTNAQIAVLKKTGAEKIKNGDTPNAQELQAMWAEWAVTNYLTKYTNATPKQAKTIAMLWAGAALFYGIKWLAKDWFSAKTFLKLWWLYAGLTMATWEDPISFLTKFYKWWSYNIPWVINKEDLGKISNSDLSKKIWQQALVESIFTWFKNPEDLTRYLKYENGQFAFDTSSFFDDVNVNPDHFYENVLSENNGVWKNVLLTALCAYKTQKPGELNKIINDFLVWDLKLDGEALKNPTILKSKIDEYWKNYRKELTARKKLFLDKSKNIKIVPGAESLVEQEIMRKGEPDEKGEKHYIYDLNTIAGRTALEAKLKQGWLITEMTYSENIWLKQEDENMLNNALAGMNPAEKEKFMKWFMEAKALLWNTNLKIRSHNDKIYLQNDGYKMPIMWDGNEVLVDFAHFSNVNTHPMSFNSYKDAILFGAAINKLFGMTVAKIDSSKDIESGDDDLITKNLRPFSFDNMFGGQLKVYKDRWPLASKFASHLKPINEIFKHLDQGTWEKGRRKNEISALATQLNSLKYPNTDMSIYIEGKWELPSDMKALLDNNTTLNTWDEIEIEYNEDNIYKLLKTGWRNILSDLWNGVYKVTKNTLKWAMELTAEVITWTPWQNTLVKLTGDIRNQWIVPWINEIYVDAKSGIVMVGKDAIEDAIPYLWKKMKDATVWLIDDFGKKVWIVTIHAGKELFKVLWKDGKELIVESIYPDMKAWVKQLFDDLVNGMKLWTDKAMEVIANIFSEKNLAKFHEIIDGMWNIVWKTIDEVLDVAGDAIKKALWTINDIVWSREFWWWVLSCILASLWFVAVRWVIRAGAHIPAAAAALP